MVHDHCPQITFRAMGCEMTAWLAAPLGEAEPALARVPATMDRYEHIFSRFIADSDLMRLNARAGEAVEVAGELFEVIERALALAEETGGLFDPTLLDALEAVGYDRSFEELVVAASGPFAPARPVPSRRAWRDVCLDSSQGTVTLPPGVRIDLGGIAKGWSAQAVARELAEHGPCMVEAGGDLVTMGAPDGLPGWFVRLVEPREAEGDMLHLWLRDVSIATSGVDRRRWFKNGRAMHHLIDPDTSLPAETDVVTATVVAPDVTSAEVWAKASLLLGAVEGIGVLADRAGLDGAVLSDDGTLYYTATMLRWIHASEE